MIDRIREIEKENLQMVKLCIHKIDWFSLYIHFTLNASFKLPN